MSGNPSVPPNNVVPMPTNWPGPMFQPKSWPQPPSCFSELASLNACYDSIQMMNQILGKVITDLVTNDKAVQAAIVEAIAASGSNVPLIGVTNGSQAQPGQVGEYLSWSGTGTIPQAANGTQTVATLVVPPGDFDLTASAVITGGFTTFSMEASTGGMASYGATAQGYSVTGGPPDIPAGWVSLTSPRTQLNVATPTLLTYAIATNFGGAATEPGNFTLFVTLRRMR